MAYTASLADTVEITVSWAVGEKFDLAHRLVEDVYRKEGYIGVNANLVSKPPRTLIFESDDQLLGCCSIYRPEDNIKSYCMLLEKPISELIPEEYEMSGFFEIGRFARCGNRRREARFFFEAYLRTIQEYGKYTGDKLWLAVLKPYLFNLLETLGLNLQVIKSNFTQSIISSMPGYFLNPTSSPVPVWSDLAASIHAVDNLYHKREFKLNLNL